MNPAHAVRRALSGSNDFDLALSRTGLAVTAGRSVVHHVPVGPRGERVTIAAVAIPANGSARCKSVASIGKDHLPPTVVDAHGIIGED